jgi:hypothetical protein
MTVKNKESIFSADAVKRQKEQEQIKKKLTNTKEVSLRKVPMNITLPIEYKEKLQSYAKEKHLSASILIQLWIDEHCV